VDKRRASTGLTKKQAAFVREYLIDLNATQAAIRCGYSKNGAKVQGHRLLTNANVAAAVESGTAVKLEKGEITQERVLHELALLSFSDVRHFEVDETTGKLELLAGAPNDAWRAVSSIKHRIITSKGGDTVREVEIKLWDKPQPLKLAGLHAGLKFIERKELTGPDGGPIPVEGITRIERVIIKGGKRGKNA